MNSIVKEESEGKKSIDPGDWISGLIDGVENFLEGRGIFLSQKAYTSFFLFLWTFTIILVYSQKAFIDVAYLPAYGLLFYFLQELFRKSPISRRFYLYVLKRPDYDFELIRQDKVTHRKVAYIIEKHATNKPQEVINIINELIEKNRFTEDIQWALFKKYYEYPFSLKEYIDDLLIKYDFSLKAIGKYLIVCRLSDDFLKRLIDKYKKHPSFLFNLGRFKLYTFEQHSNEKKYYTMGYNFKNYTKVVYYINIIFVIVMSFSILVLDLSYLTQMPLIFGSIVGKTFYVFSPLLLLLSLTVFNAIKYWFTKKKIRTLLKKDGLQLEEIELEKFINELNLK